MRTVITQREQWPTRMADLARLPEDTELFIEEYPATANRARTLRHENVQQKGPAVFHNLFNDPARRGGKAERFWVARDKNGTIHAVGHTSHDYSGGKRNPLRDIYINDLYSSSVAPFGSGTKIMQAIAQRAKADGANLWVKGIVPVARNYYEQLGAELNPSSSIGDWSEEARDALAAGHPTPPAEHSLWEDAHGQVKEPPVNPGEDQMVVVPEEYRVPGAMHLMDLDLR